MPRAIALIPARSGSKRVISKNIRPLAGFPLFAYTICAAVQSGVFERVIVSTDSLHYANRIPQYGAEVLHRKPEHAADDSPDIDWVEAALTELGWTNNDDIFSILRPTSPFRTAATIQRAMSRFMEHGHRTDSLRAVEPLKQHPGKMWWLGNGEDAHMRPFWGDRYHAPGWSQPYHSMPTQSLPPLYVQNASLEIAWARVVKEGRTISGLRVLPFFTEGYEGFDINREEDFLLAELLAERGLATLPTITQREAVS